MRNMMCNDATFRSFSIALAMLLLLSVAVYSRIEHLDDDDLVASGLGFYSTIRARIQLERLRFRHQKQVFYEKKKGVITRASPQHALHSLKEEWTKAKQAHAIHYDFSPEIQKFQQHQERLKETRQRANFQTVREAFEKKNYDHPDSITKHNKAVVAKLHRHPPPQTYMASQYDIHNCPRDPPQGYPFSWNLLDVLSHWNPTNPKIPIQIYQGLCVFDWETQEDRARNYRELELPFVITNFPEAIKTAERWNTPDYLQKLIGVPRSAQHYHHGHENNALRYSQWLEHATKVEKADKNNNSINQDQKDPWDFALSTDPIAAVKGETPYLYEEFPFFDPTFGETFTMVSPNDHNGIHCQFGMKGSTAEEDAAHFDTTNNFITVLGGQKRYILAHPDQCENMELNPPGHPNARHSKVDWSTNLKKQLKRPIHKARVTEVVLQAGDMMYLPTYWFHYAVSLSTNYECASSSGTSFENQQHIVDCGFDVGTGTSKDL